jgi:hypothetical protein
MSESLEHLPPYVLQPIQLQKLLAFLGLTFSRNLNHLVAVFGGLFLG